MPVYAVLTTQGDLSSGIILGESKNSGIPSGSVVSPNSYELFKNEFPLLLTIDSGDIRKMTLTEKQNVGQSTIDAFKEYKKNLVDAKTNELLNSGFEYPASSGNFFDIENDARPRWIGIQQASDKGVMNSITVRDKNRNPLLLANATDIGIFWGSALNFEVSITTAGGALLDSIESATTIAELEAIIDNR